MLNHDLLFSVPCYLLSGSLIKETTCNVMVDHLQSRGTPWCQCLSHVNVHGNLSKMNASVQRLSLFSGQWLSQNHKIQEKLILPFSGDNKRKKYLYNNPEFETKFIPLPCGCKPKTNINYVSFRHFYSGLLGQD